MSYTLDHKTKASNAGRIKVNPLPWLLYHKKQAFVELGSLLIVLGLSFFISKWLLFLLLIPIYQFAFNWIRLFEHCWHGNSTPGIVLDEKKKIVGLLTNLSNNGQKKLALKVMKIKSINPLIKGSIIPAISLYTADTNIRKTHWIDFDPIPIHYVSWWKSDVDFLMKYYEKKEVRLLHDVFTSIKTDISPGLYRIRLDEDDWEYDCSVIPYELHLRPSN